MASAKKPPSGLSRATPAKKDHMHSVVKTIAKSSRKRAKSIVFAPQIELERGPHYSPRVSKHMARTPEALKTPEKKDAPSAVQKHLPRGSPGARPVEEPAEEARVLGFPPTSRLAALGTFFFPLRPRVPLLEAPPGPTTAVDEENTVESPEDEVIESEDSSDAADASQSTFSVELSEESDPPGDAQNLSANLEKETPEEPGDDFEIDSETDESSESNVQAAKSTTHTPSRRKSIGERLSGLFFGTPAPVVENPSEEAVETPSGEETVTATEEESEAHANGQAEEEEEEGSESASESGSSPSNSSESEFLTVPEEPVPQEPTPRRKSLLGSAFSAVVAAVASPARSLFGRSSSVKAEAPSSPSEDTLDMEDEMSSSAMLGVNPTSDSGEAMKSGEELRDTTSNLLDRFNTEAENAALPVGAPSPLKSSEKTVEVLSEANASTPVSPRAAGAMEPSAEVIPVAAHTPKSDSDAAVKDVMDVEVVDTPKSMQNDATDGAATPVKTAASPKKIVSPHVPTDYNAWKVKELHEYLNGINIPTSRTMRKAELVALAQKAELLVKDPEEEVVSVEKEGAEADEVDNEDAGVEDEEEPAPEPVDDTAGGDAKSKEEIKALLTERKVPYLRSLLRRCDEDDRGRKAELIETLLSKSFATVLKLMDQDEKEEEEAEPSETSVLKDEENANPENESMESETPMSEKYEERKSELKAMTVKKLQVILGKLKLDKLGKKDILIDRILSSEFGASAEGENQEEVEENSENDSDLSEDVVEVPVSKTRAAGKASRHASSAKKAEKEKVAKDAVEDLQRMTVAQLRRYLRENSSCSFGLKAVLLARAERLQSPPPAANNV